MKQLPEIIWVIIVLALILYFVVRVDGGMGIKNLAAYGTHTF